METGKARRRVEIRRSGREEEWVVRRKEELGWVVWVGTWSLATCSTLSFLLGMAAKVAKVQG